jgi:hypothetical protein
LNVIAVKVGQALSIRPDLASPAYLEELVKLQDQVPPFSSKIALQIVGMYIYMCTYVCRYMNMFIYIHTYIYVYIYVGMYSTDCRYVDKMFNIIIRSNYL